MAGGHTASLLRHLHCFALRPDGATASDGQLLERFLNRKDEAAFEALVRRYAGMVFGVCRRVLRNEADAEDAFQATFLVLARKAASIRPKDAVGNWLYGVAFRTAMKARSMSARRKTKEMQIEPRESYDVPNDNGELLSILDQEIERLPQKYRLALVLCELNGLSRKEAARQLKIPVGTLSSRLSRGKARLAKRFAQRGITFSAGALTTGLAQNTAAGVPPNTLVSATVQAATRIAAGQAAAGLVSNAVATLTEGVLKMMLVNNLKSFSVLLLLGILCVGAVPLLMPAAAQDDERVANRNPAEKPPTNKSPKQKSDHERIQGQWLVVRKEQGSKIGIPDSGAVVTFTKNKMIFDDPDRGTQEATYRLDPSKAPKWIDVTEGNKLNQGIYKFDGDHLIIAINNTGAGGRPKFFVIDGVLMTLKRAPQSKNKGTNPKAKRSKEDVHLGQNFKKLQFDKLLPLNVQSNPVKKNKPKLRLIGIGGGTFHLSKDARLTAKLNAVVTQFAKVDYWIYAAVFDKKGTFLGTASHKEQVEYMRLGSTPTIFREIELDFGISNAFRRAAFVTVTIGERDVPIPGAAKRNK